MQKQLFFLLVCIACLLLGVHTAGALEIPWGDIIDQSSIGGNISSGDKVELEDVRSFGIKILSFLKILISGVALIFIVLIGVYLVAFSDSEEEIKKQKQQILYALLGFLFLNIPTAILSIFFPGETREIPWDPSGGWSQLEGNDSIFWNSLGFGGFLGDIISFLRVFVFGIAVLIFTWGAFEMIVSRGIEENYKRGRNRIMYGIIVLIFMAFVEAWGRWVAAPDGDIRRSLEAVAGPALGIAFFFAAPIAVAFMIYGAYFYITSGGDEDRAKKGKVIIINTLIASVILIASFSFLQELLGFLS